jgi:hypothetical protein
MKRRTLVVAGLVAVSGLLVYYLGLRFIFGYRIDLGRLGKDQGGKAVPGSAGVVMMLDPGSGQRLGQVQITAYNQIYAAIGIDRDKFSMWVSTHGPSGAGQHGEVLAPAFPVLSKVAWMFVDPVDLTGDEARALTEECERAAARTSDSDAIKQFEAIRGLAADALARSANVRFGYA